MEDAAAARELGISRSNGSTKQRRAGGRASGRPALFDAYAAAAGTHVGGGGKERRGRKGRCLSAHWPQTERN
jgi:hypothetical protein